MSQLSYLEKLLNGEIVEWIALGEVTLIKTGQAVSKQAISTNPGQYPVINSGREPLGFIDKWNTDNDPIGITTRGAGVGSITWQEGKYFRGNLNYSVTIKDSANLEVRYLYHLLHQMQSAIQSLCTFDGIPALNAGSLKGLEIPIPCPDNPEKSLAIQSEIVRILDKFTALTAELTAELNMRKKQYNYYRDKLLSFEEGEVEWKTLGEVTRLITKGTTPKGFVSSGVNFIKLESFDDNQIKPDKFMFITPEVHNRELKRSILEEGDILFAIAGATIGKCAIVDKSVLPANTNQALAIVRLSHEVNVKFAFYYMQTTAMTDYIARFNKTSAQPNINLKQMSEFKIPVPSINEQTRIVKILDNFNTLTSSIKEGLPREIELRQKQYEYYRDLLLSFPKSDEAA
ncbi:restriction endonuclease subunit S [Morganella morganii]|uniref:restriction endonuclease subunit S n=1 Tax=Morganella morganii TaxID=582 RepID=UPI003DA111DF